MMSSLDAYNLLAHPGTLALSHTGTQPQWHSATLALSHTGSATRGGSTSGRRQCNARAHESTQALENKTKKKNCNPCPCSLLVPRPLPRLPLHLSCRVLVSPPLHLSCKVLVSSAGFLLRSSSNLSNSQNKREEYFPIVSSGTKTAVECTSNEIAPTLWSACASHNRKMCSGLIRGTRHCCHS